MQQDYVNICGESTKVITFGKGIEESFSNDEQIDIIVCIPGIPGIADFYCEFLSILHKKLGYPVWIVGYAGHEAAKNVHNTHPRFKNEELYGLHGQIVHKRTFIETYVPKNANIHFVGHSTGCHIILELLKIPTIRSMTVGNYLLFPAIERVAETRNGKFVFKAISQFLWLMVLWARVFIILPTILQSWIANFYLMARAASKIHLQTIINLIDPDIVQNICRTAFDVMVLVKERQNDVLMENKHIIKLYYNERDQWVPPNYGRNLKRDIPDIDAEICTRKLHHSFVFCNSIEVGEMVAGWIIHRKQ